MLGDEIAAALGDQGGLTVVQLAEKMGEDAGTISFALFADHGRFRRDAGAPPRWWLVSPAGNGARRAPEPPAGRLIGAARDRSERPATGGGGGARVLSPAGGARNPVSLPSPSASLGLYQWQKDALRAWHANGRRGVVEAVTGAGKTMVGIAAALEELARRGQVVVLVPTVELQRQWSAQLAARLPALSSAGRMGAGRMGAGQHDSLASHDILVAVVNSARSQDVRPTRQGGLLIADECHRYGSAFNRLALDGRFRRRLGLSATYARDDDGNLEWLDPYFGGTCFRLGYDRAVRDGIVARFTVTLSGVELPAGERAYYDELTEQMGALWRSLVERYGLPETPFEEFMRALAGLADSDNAGASTARSYRRAMLERRRLLADTEAKDWALARLAPEVRAAERTLVFTQSIAAAERASRVLASCGFRAAAVHSAMAPRERAEVLPRFAKGNLSVLVAPRVLDEGIDVPTADLAVIAGASRSRRQMVQRMGRVLRRKPGGRWARFIVLYAERTVEDPASGAHEAFLHEVVPVAEEVTYTHGPKVAMPAPRCHG
jgi:RNA polymerase primary sigma factor